MKGKEKVIIYPKPVLMVPSLGRVDSIGSPSLPLRSGQIPFNSFTPLRADMREGNYQKNGRHLRSPLWVFDSLRLFGQSFTRIFREDHARESNKDFNKKTRQVYFQASTLKNGLKTLLILILMIISGFLLNACQLKSIPSPTPSPVHITMTQTYSQTFRVVGYVTTAVDPETIPYDKVTHINYAFLLPKVNGSFETKINAWKLDHIVRDAKSNDVKVLISVGGWGYAAEYEIIAADPETREIFVANLKQFVEEHQLDGIDIDWEYPLQESRDNFLALMREIRAALPMDKLLTAAVVSQGENGEGIPAASFQYLDFVNVMAYDGIEHASLNQAQGALDYWLSRGIPKSKLVLGVPFYSRPIAIPYHTLLELNPDAAYLDEIEYQDTRLSFNGIPSMREKTQVALHRASGIMIWNLEYDSQDNQTSLLQAITEILLENQ